jgi:hypothetical protein
MTANIIIKKCKICYVEWLNLTYEPLTGQMTFDQMTEHCIGQMSIFQMVFEQKNYCHLGFTPFGQKHLANLCKSLVDHLTVGQMSVGQISVGKMSVGQISVGKMSVGQMSTNVCR